MGARFTDVWACRPCGPAGWLALMLTKAGDVETNPGPTTLNKQVWICDICHKHIQVCRLPRTPTLSQHTHMQHKQQYMHHSHRNNRTHNIGYYDNLINRPRTTTGLLTPHKHTDPAVKGEKSHHTASQHKRIQDSRCSNCLFTTHMQTSSQFRKPSSPLKPKRPKYITSKQCAAIGCTRQGGGLIRLIRDNITFTTTDISSTINTHNTELQIVKVHINNTKRITIANIYIPPRDTTSTHYKTADTDIQHCIHHTTPQSSPEM